MSPACRPTRPAHFFASAQKTLTNNVESGYLTLVKTNLGFTHQGIVRLWLVGRLYAPVWANSGKMTLRLEGGFFTRFFLQSYGIAIFIEPAKSPQDRLYSDL